jgi:succinate dehydrogenase / fumarate reductase flavoprotein subunit
MQGLADGYFIIPYTLPDFLARNGRSKVLENSAEFQRCEDGVRAQISRFIDRSSRGERTIMDFYRELGLLLWEHVGMSRSEAGLKKARERLAELRAEFESGVKIAGSGDTLNKNLEFAGRVADYLELADLMIADALHRTESCGAHFRVESQTEQGEAKRDDAHFSYVAAWEHRDGGEPPLLHKEPLAFESVKPSQRSYE